MIFHIPYGRFILTNRYPDKICITLPSKSKGIDRGYFVKYEKKHQRDLEKIKESLNSLSTFRLDLKENKLPNSKNWYIECR
jgi:hypothetical protein